MSRQKTDLTNKEYYRPAAIAVVFNAEGELLIVQLASYSKNDWRFPGGGIENSETPEEAIIRELKEELGSSMFKVIEKSHITDKYEWPRQVREKSLLKYGIAFKGQSVTQLLVKFYGKKSDIKIDKIEIRKLKWVKYRSLKKYFHFPNQFKMATRTIRSFKYKIPNINYNKKQNVSHTVKL